MLVVCYFIQHSDFFFPSKIVLRNSFEGINVGNIQETSLTMMYDGRNIDPESILQLQPMEIYTYKMKLE